MILDDLELRLDEEPRTGQQPSRPHLLPQPSLRTLMSKGRWTWMRAIPTMCDRVTEMGAALVVTSILKREFEAASCGCLLRDGGRRIR